MQEASFRQEILARRSHIHHRANLHQAAGRSLADAGRIDREF